MNVFRDVFVFITICVCACYGSELARLIDPRGSVSCLQFFVANNDSTSILSSPIPCNATCMRNERLAIQCSNACMVSLRRCINPCWFPKNVTCVQSCSRLFKSCRNVCSGGDAGKTFCCHKQCKIHLKSEIENCETNCSKDSQDCLKSCREDKSCENSCRRRFTDIQKVYRCFYSTCDSEYRNCSARCMQSFPHTRRTCKGICNASITDVCTRKCKTFNP